MDYIGPYSTKNLSAINLAVIIEKLTPMLVKNLSYGIVVDDSRFLIITGHTEEEKSLPSWELPIILEDAMGRKVIAIDARKKLKNIPIGEIMELNPLINDKAGFRLISNIGIIALRVSENNYASIRNIQNGLSIGFAKLLNAIVNSIITLSPNEEQELQLMAVNYITALYTKNYNLNERNTVIVTRLQNANLGYGKPSRTVIESEIGRASCRERVCMFV